MVHEKNCQTAGVVATGDLAAAADVAANARPARRLTLRGALGAMPPACAVLAILASGCGASKFTHINETVGDFQRQVINATQPVLVEFYKGGCATCGLLEPTLDQLADEYAGRLSFISFEMMRPYFAVSCPELQKRHRIAYYPTIVLFVNGEEKGRWVLDYSIDNYRKVLNEIVGEPPKKPTQETGESPATDATSAGSTGPAAGGRTTAGTGESPGGS